MTEKHIRIDMDFNSNPVWFSEDGKTFLNGDIEELNLNDDLNISLKNYAKLWLMVHANNSNASVEIKDDLFGSFDSLEEFVIVLAKQIQKELPNKIIYVWNDADSFNQKVSDIK